CVCIAPDDSAIADFEFEVVSTSGLVAFCDGAYMAIIPKDSDIDATKTTNGPAEADADVTGPRVLGNGILNGSFEAGDVHWTKDSSRTIVNDTTDARMGSWAAKLTTGGSNQRIRSSTIQVAEGDRVLAHAFCKRTGGTGDLRVRIQWMQADGTEISRT